MPNAVRFAPRSRVTRRRGQDATPITRVEDLPPPSLGAGLRLVVVSDGILASYPLPASGEATIGRSSRCDVSLDHDSLSRTHVLLRLGAHMEIEDCGSKNGTTVRGVRLEPGRRVHLHVGEAALLGGVTVLVQRGGGPEHAVAAASQSAA